MKLKNLYLVSIALLAGMFAACSDDTESIAREKILMRAKTCALAAELQKMVEHVPAVEEWRRVKMSLWRFGR